MAESGGVGVRGTYGKYGEYGKYGKYVSRKYVSRKYVSKYVSLSCNYINEGARSATYLFPASYVYRRA